MLTTWSRVAWNRSPALPVATPARWPKHAQTQSPSSSLPMMSTRTGRALSEYEHVEGGAGSGTPAYRANESRRPPGLGGRRPIFTARPRCGAWSSFRDISAPHFQTHLNAGVADEERARVRDGVPGHHLRLHLVALEWAARGHIDPMDDLHGEPELGRLRLDERL